MLFVQWVCDKASELLDIVDSVEARMTVIAILQRLFRISAFGRGTAAYWTFEEDRQRCEERDHHARRLNILKGSSERC